MLEYAKRFAVLVNSSDCYANVKSNSAVIQSFEKCSVKKGQKS